MNIEKRLKSFVFAFKGIVDLFKHTPNARIHLGLTVVSIIGGIYFNIQWIEWCLIILAIAMVLAAEAFNSGLEYLTDLVSPDYHPLAGKAKDIAAGAVLLTAVGAASIGFIIFLPRILEIGKIFLS